MNITLKQLRAFVAIARTENVSNASRQLCLTQSAVSMALKELELQLGSLLFDRAGKRLQLNANGQWLFPKAMRILDQVEEIGSELGMAGRQQLAIGASTTIADCLYPKLAQHLFDLDPMLDLHLETGNSDHILALLLARKIDLGLVEGVCQHPQATSTPWWTDRLVIVAGPQHPLAEMASESALSVSDLYDSNWILREPGSGTRAIFEHTFRAHLSRFTVRAELKHLPTIKALVAASTDHLTCLSEISVAGDISEGRLVPLSIHGMSLERQFYIIEHRQAYHSQKLQELMDWIGQAARSRLEQQI